MKQTRAVAFSLLMVLLCGLFSAAQQSATATTNATVPPLIPFSSVATDEGGSSLSGVVNITFSLYTAQQGGAPLWTETQNNIQLDSTGHYSVQLGITQPNGVPTTLFTTTEARWLGVQIAEQPEQPRVLLLSVPYALKAGDAATLGGLPLSAFVLAASASGSTPSAPSDASAAAQSSAPPPTGTAVTGTGTVNFLPLWDSTSDIISSVLFQFGTGATAKLGINTTTPSSTLDVKGGGTIRGTLSLPATGNATATKGANSQPLDFAASSFSSTTGKAVAETFQWQAEPVGNDTTTNSGTLNLLFGSGTTKPAETGLNIASNGVITFNTAQTFPNTITGVATATGSGLTGGGTSGSLSLGLLTTCATNQVLQWNGTTWACATVGGSGGSGTVTSVATGLGLKGGPITTSGTLTIDTTVVPQLGAATNTFTGTVNANVVNATTGFYIGGVPFAFGTSLSGSGLGNMFIGFGGNSSMTGVGNVGVGYAALLPNTTGEYNTAVGLEALFTNSSGQQNTAVGTDALFANGGGSGSTGNANTAVGFGAGYNNVSGFNNTAAGFDALYNNTTGTYNTAIGGYTLNFNASGTYNTAIGYSAGPTNGSSNLTNSTAIGANAAVSESNALVLGGTGPNAVKVGIGTTAPAYTLDAAGTIRSSSGGFMFPDGTIQSTAATGGGGSITGVTAGTGLTGGGTSGNVTLSINTATIPQLSAANAFSGTITAGTSSSSSFGVLGESNAATGQNYGVGGLAQSPSGYGVEGLNVASGGTGVYGYDSSGTGVSGSGITGVSGSGSTYGVYGTSTAASAWGVYGVSTGAGTTVGVFGSGAWGVQGSGTAYGVYGNGPTGVQGDGTTYGVYGSGPTGVVGSSAYPAGYGVEGVNTLGGIGVYGTGYSGVSGNGTSYGVFATGPYGVYATGGTYGVYATGTGNGTGYGVYGTGGASGVYGVGSGGNDGVGGLGGPNGGDGGFFAGGTTNGVSFGGVGAGFLGADGGDFGGDGVVGTGGGSDENNPGYGGWFNGNINVTGTVFGGSKDFKIDHPLDPANKYLLHSSVESSEMMNIYTGNITTDGEGLATVQLPDWFEVLNTDFRYQLTVIGQFAQAIVGSKVADHQFGIRTDKPSVEVSWQITGVRQDAYAKAHPLVVEQEKDERERGHYIYPELYGAPEEQSIAWARHPAMMKKIQETRARQLAAAQGQTTTNPAETLPLAVPPTPKATEPRTPQPAPIRPSAGSKRQSGPRCNRRLRNHGVGVGKTTTCAHRCAP